MSGFKKICSFLFVLSFFAFHNFTHAYVANVQLAMDSNGNVLAVWQDELNTGYFNLFASVLPAGGTWSTPVNISLAGGINANIPKLAINKSGNAVVIWTAYNNTMGYNSLYGVTLTGLTTWSSAVQISDNDENMYDNYSIKLADNDEMGVVWSSYSYLTFQSIIRGVTGNFGTWPAPVTIAP